MVETEEKKIPTYKDLGFDDNLRRLVVENSKFIDASVFDAFFEIAEGQIKNENMADNAIEASNIAELAIEARNIASEAITEAKIAGDAVTAGKIAANAVGADEIAANAVTSEKIYADAITAEKIAAGAIIAEAIGTNEIIANTANIKDGVITSAKIISLNADVITAGTITGRTLRTAVPAAGVGESVTIEGGSSKYVKFYYNASEVGYIRGYTTDGAEVTYIEITASSGRKIKLKNSYIEFNGSIASNSDNADQCGLESKRWSKGWFEDVICDDLQVNDGIVIKGTTVDEGDDGTYGFQTALRWDDGDLQYKYRTFTIKCGIVTGIGGESGWNTV